MIAIESGDLIEGDATTASEVDFQIYGVDDYTLQVVKNLADGQLANAKETLYTADSTDVVTTIILVNTGAAHNHVNLYHKPSGGTSRRLFTKDLQLESGYSLHWEGGKCVILTTSGAISQTIDTTAFLDDTAGGTDALITKAPTSNVMYDHTAATAAHGATGAVVGTTNTQTLTLKTLTTPIIATLYQDAGKTKLVTMPAATDTLVGKDTTDTLTLKTLTTPVIASFYQDAGKTKLMTVPNTASDTLCAIGATQTLENKTLGNTTFGGIMLCSEMSMIEFPVTALSANGTWRGRTKWGVAGAALAFGDLVYYQTADSKWELASADNAAVGHNMKLGMCLSTANENAVARILLWGEVRADTAFPALTIGAPVFMGTTAGDIQVAAPTGSTDIVRIVGYGNTADELFFCPDNTYLELV